MSDTANQVLNHTERNNATYDQLTENLFNHTNQRNQRCTMTVLKIYKSYLNHNHQRYQRSINL